MNLEAIELVELAEEYRDGINYFIKHVQDCQSEDYETALNELRMLKRFYHMKEFTNFFDKVA